MCYQYVSQRRSLHNDQIYEDTKGVIRSRKLKDRQYNDQKKKKK